MKKNKVKNKDENLKLFIYAVYKNEFYIRKKHLCWFRKCNFSLLKIKFLRYIHCYWPDWKKNSYFNFFDETGATQKLYQSFKGLINALLLYLWEYEYISIVGLFRKMYRYINHVLSFIGLLSKLWHSNDRIMLKKDN